MATIWSGDLELFCILSRAASSSRQGEHHGAQKVMRVGLPLRSESHLALNSGSLNSRSGNRRPMTRAMAALPADSCSWDAGGLDEMLGEAAPRTFANSKAWACICGLSRMSAIS